VTLLFGVNMQEGELPIELSLSIVLGLAILQVLQ